MKRVCCGRKYSKLICSTVNVRKKAVKEHIDQKLKIIVIRNNSARNSAESPLPSDVCQVPITPVIIACTHPISWSLFGKHLLE